MMYSMDELLPHKGSAILVDRVLDWDTDKVLVSVSIEPGIPFFVFGRGVPSYVGLEYMAQACGVHAGVRGKEHGADVRIGFLLGTRNYKCTQEWFGPGSTLEITAEEIFCDNQLGSYKCVIVCEEKEIASAQLSVYQPDDAKSYFQ